MTKNRKQSLICSIFGMIIITAFLIYLFLNITFAMPWYMLLATMILYCMLMSGCAIVTIIGIKGLKEKDSPKNIST